MSSTTFKAFIVPRNKDETDLSWLLNTRKYLRSFEAARMYKEILGRKDIDQVSIDDWVKAKNLDTNRDIFLSIYTSAPDYTHSHIATYLANAETKDLGLALAIEFEKFEQFYRSGVEISELIIYLENNILNENEVNFIKDNNEIIENIFNRIIDNQKIMYHNLLKNFFMIIKNSGLDNLSIIFTKKKIQIYVLNFIKDCCN